MNSTSSHHQLESETSSDGNPTHAAPATAAEKSGAASLGMSSDKNAIMTLLEGVAKDLARLCESYARANSGALDSAQLASGRAKKILEQTAYARALLLAQIPRFLGLKCPQPHVIVFGGTQVGKSTIVNVLLGGVRAKVHHTAGFTRHAQAFVQPDLAPEDLFGQNPWPFSEFQRVSRSSLSNERLMEYCVEITDRTSRAGEVVLWDAPDCDAVGSQTYMPGMVEALALADVVVYVTSSQKYAIRHVLEWVAEIRDSGKPVVSLLNMTPRQHQADLLASMLTAMETVEAECASDRGILKPKHFTPTPAVAFDFINDGDSSLLISEEYAPGIQLAQFVANEAHKSSQNETIRHQAELALEYAQSRLPMITAAALAETEARDEFATLSNQALEQFVEDYRLNYLEDPSNYDAFTYVGMEILKLLDPPIPGVKRAISGIRNILAMPAKLLVFGAKSVYRSFQPQTDENNQNSHQKNPKGSMAVQLAHDQLLNTVSREIARKAQQYGGSLGFWKSMDWAWEKALPDIEAEFRHQLIRLEEEHAEHIRRAAMSIYTEISKDPVKLNLLRTGRLTADAAAIVLSVKTAGHGGEFLHSLILAPIMLSITEAASQMIADNHVSTLRQQLKSSLLADTKKMGHQVYNPRFDLLGQEATALAGYGTLDAHGLRSLPARLEKLRTALMTLPAEGSHTQL